MTNITGYINKDKAIELIENIIRQGNMNLVVYLRPNDVAALKLAQNALRSKPICEVDQGDQDQDWEQAQNALRSKPICEVVDYQDQDQDRDQDQEL